MNKFINKMDNYYSPYKAVLHADKLRQLQKGEMITPLFAQIDLTNTCNLNCNFCSYKVGNYSPDHMKDFKMSDRISLEVIKKSFKDMRMLGVKAIEITGGGEPSLHPNYKEIIKYAKELEFELALVTNGTLLDDESIELIKDFEWVRFSLDASTSETYELIKGNPGFNTAINNLKKLIKIKKRENMVGISFIVCKDNYFEIYNTTILAKKLGADNIRFSIAYTPEGDKPFIGIWDTIINGLERSKKEETKDFKVFSFSNRINDISQKTKNDSCYFHEFVASIGANGSIYPCCLLKYDPRFNFGNLNNESFESIWFGNKRKEFTEKVRTGCPFSCWMREKNQFLDFLVKKDIKHKNFI